MGYDSYRMKWWWACKVLVQKAGGGFAVRIHSQIPRVCKAGACRMGLRIEELPGRADRKSFNAGKMRHDPTEASLILSCLRVSTTCAIYSLMAVHTAVIK